MGERTALRFCFYCMYCCCSFLFFFLFFSFVLSPNSLPDFLCRWVPQWRSVGLPAPKTTFWKGTQLTEASACLHTPGEHPSALNPKPQRLLQWSLKKITVSKGAIFTKPWKVFPWGRSGNGSCCVLWDIDTPGTKRFLTP